MAHIRSGDLDVLCRPVYVDADEPSRRIENRSQNVLVYRCIVVQPMRERLEVLRRGAKVDFDQKFFPDLKNWPSATGRAPS